MMMNYFRTALTLTVIEAAAVVSAAATFNDDFNRPDGAVGGDWTEWGHGADISGSWLRTFGQNDVAGGAQRQFTVTPGEYISFGFDFRTDLPGGGGWEIQFNTTHPAHSGYGESGSRLTLLGQYYGSQPIFFVVGNVLHGNLVPAHARNYTATARIEGLIQPDLSAVVTINYGDGGPNDSILFNSPGVNPLTVPQGVYLSIGNSSGYYGPHYFDNLVVTSRIGPLGDLNCDGVINFADIDPFVLALTSGSGYQTAYPNCDRDLADCNSDGYVDFGDIDPFVAILSGE